MALLILGLLSIPSEVYPSCRLNVTERFLMVVLELKSSPCYKICIRGWEEFLCFLVELFKINLLLSTHNIKVMEFISEQLWNISLKKFISVMGKNQQDFFLE
ncbi:hypothetical protein BpHYR1_019534 [Brachionus plicatilis]|uniref:Uncharacterized protein n=1 Tax=Brachionus plicatilis TaxID=10195 RepID=A0A3M7RI47_BRAPC|nr:hypothetical protein BpHYR1_019534 [Brachionus plicatilis]